jgi:hypothetical protein
MASTHSPAWSAEQQSEERPLNYLPKDKQKVQCKKRRRQGTFATGVEGALPYCRTYMPFKCPENVCQVIPRIPTYHRDITSANKLLKYPYSLPVKVVSKSWSARFPLTEGTLLVYLHVIRGEKVESLVDRYPSGGTKQRNHIFLHAHKPHPFVLT